MHCDEHVKASELDFVQIDATLIEAAIKALEDAKRQGLQVATAESCTGGLIVAVLSEAPGAAEHLAGGFVVYTPEQKCAALGLDPDLIARCGAVSEQVATAMAEGALACSEADIAVAVTGVAGPDPDERGNPVGLVFVAGARKDLAPICSRHDYGNIGRASIRRAAALDALAVLSSLSGRRANRAFGGSGRERAPSPRS